MDRLTPLDGGQEPAASSELRRRSIRTDRLA